MLDAHLGVVFNRGSALYHGAVFRNHPTPSGCPRYLLAQTLNPGQPTERAAATAINAAFPEIKPLDVEAHCDEAIPTLPRGALLTRITPHGARAEDPAITVEAYASARAGAPTLPKPVSAAQLAALVAAGRVEPDSSSGDDPELSARYDHFVAL